MQTAGHRRGHPWFWSTVCGIGLGSVELVFFQWAATNLAPTASVWESKPLLFALVAPLAISLACAPRVLGFMAGAVVAFLTAVFLVESGLLWSKTCGGHAFCETPDANFSLRVFAFLAVWGFLFGGIFRVALQTWRDSKS